MRKLIIVNGLPGSGKGTQAELIAKTYHLIHISSGQLIRDTINSNRQDEFTKKVRERYNAGILQPDSAAIKLVEDKIESISPEQGVIFDSFPINLDQAKLFEKIRNEYNFEPPIYIIINITPEEAIDRLKTRKICEKCGYPVIDTEGKLHQCQKCGGQLVNRLDDRPEIVKGRIDTYLPLIKSLREYYQKTGSVKDVDGIGRIEDVYNRVVEAING